MKRTFARTALAAGILLSLSQGAYANGINSPAGVDVHIGAGGNQVQTITAAGLVGIGTATPHANLSVNGGVQIGTDAVCDSTKAGTLSFDSSTKQLEVCDGATLELVGGSAAQYSQTCSDWQSKGWPSPAACIQDGRWHMVYANSANGANISGSLSALQNAVGEGASVKVVTPNEGGLNMQTYWNCSVAIVDDNTGAVACLDPARFSGDVFGQQQSNNQDNNAIGASIELTTGRVSCNAFNPAVSDTATNSGVYSPVTGIRIHTTPACLTEDMYWYVQF